MKEYLIRPGRVHYFKDSKRSVPADKRGKAFLVYKMAIPGLPQKHNKVFYDKDGNQAGAVQLTDIPCKYKECPCH